MADLDCTTASKAIVAAADLYALTQLLAARGYRVLGPVVRDGAIVYDDIASLDDLPAGWTDRQEPGRYALERRDDAAWFGYAVGPHSWKRFLHPPIETLWRAQRNGDGFDIATPEPETSRFAFIGVRACELKAIAIQDRVLMDGPYAESGYTARRADNFIVAVNCAVSGGTCFCASMDAGPKADAGFDLALTELLDSQGHRFLVETGSEAGAAILAGLTAHAASAAEIETAAAILERTASSMGRTLDTNGLKELLQSNLTHPRWEEVASRCVACGNCTMVCPTCFCTNVVDHTDLTGESAERVRHWDSCFTLDFSHMHGGSVRTATASRYRQWMTHKLAGWIDQFGTSGCVGCGRCMTWCPVGIDITVEAAAIRAEPQSAAGPIQPDGEHHAGA